MNLQEKHIELVEAVNNTKTQASHDRAMDKLEGFREALKLVVGQHQYGWALMECDLHYKMDRPMCCGVFLDWEPSQ